MADRTKLTKRTVDAAAPTGARYVVHDSELTGFRLVIGASGSKAFYVRYRTADGTIREPKVGAYPGVTVDEARRIAKDWLADVAKGRDPSADRKASRSAPTMRDLFDRFLTEYGPAKKKASSLAGDRLRIERHLAAAFGKQKVAAVKRSDVSEFMAKMAGSPIEANRCLALLSKAFNLAEVWDLRATHTNPCRHVERNRENMRRRFLSPAELGRLGEALRKAEDGELGHVTWQSIAFVRLAVFTGARKGELLGLRWSDVDHARGVATLADSKTGFKQLRLPPAALHVLANLRRVEGNEHVLPGQKAGASLVNVNKNGWFVIRTAAGLGDVHLHDLRHSFAAVGAGSGQSLHVIGGLLGHTQAQTTKRYAHLADDPLREASERISSQIAVMMEPKPPASVVPLRKGRRE